MDKKSHYRDRVKFSLKMKKNYTILSPSMAPIHFKILKPILLRQGFHIEIMDAEGPEVLQLAQKYLHNDMCYPAMLTTGQMLATIMSGKYDPATETISYENGTKKVFTYTEEGEPETETVEYTNDKGVFVFSYNGVTWEEYNENIAEGMVFTKEI